MVGSLVNWLDSYSSRSEIHQCTMMKIESDFFFLSSRYFRFCIHLYNKNIALKGGLETGSQPEFVASTICLLGPMRMEDDNMFRLKLSQSALFSSIDRQVLK